MNVQIRPELVYLTQMKSMVAAYALWLFLGYLGAHRFYMGRIPSGVGMLLLNFFSVVLTLILIGYIGIMAGFVWWVIDACLIPGWVNKHNATVLSQMPQ